MSTSLGRFRRPFLMIGAMVGALTLLVACGTAGSDDGSSGDGAAASGVDSAARQLLPQQMQDSGVLKVGTVAGSAPFAFVQPGQTKLEGLDIDMIDAIAAKLGLKTQIQAVSYPGLVPGLESKRSDVILSALVETPAKIEVLDFVDYLKIWNVLLVRAESKDDITSVADLCGKPASVAKGSTNLAVYEEQQTKCGADPIKIIQVDDYDFAQLGSGRTDALIMNYAVAKEAVKRAPDQFAAVDAKYNGAIGGIGLAKGNEDVRDAVQAALKALIADGTYAKILQKYDLADMSHTEAGINGGSAG